MKPGNGFYPKYIHGAQIVFWRWIKTVTLYFSKHQSKRKAQSTTLSTLQDLWNPMRTIINQELWKGIDTPGTNVSSGFCWKLIKSLLQGLQQQNHPHKNTGRNVFHRTVCLASLVLAEGTPSQLSTVRANWHGTEIMMPRHDAFWSWTYSEQDRSKPKCLRDVAGSDSVCA